MKGILAIGLFLAVVLLSNCTKSDDGIPHINCDGILTDTSGTGDTGRIYMPNAFTPNNDGLNDTIRPFAKNIQSISFTIYDDINNVIFSTNQQGQGWATTADPNTSTIYYYKIQAVTSSGHNIGKCGAFYKLSCVPASAPTLFFEDQLTQNGFTDTTMESLPVCP